MSTATLVDFSIGELVTISAPEADNTTLRGKLALVASKPQTVETGNGQTATAYAVNIAASDRSYAGKTFIVYGSEISPAPESNRYDDDNLVGDILAKRDNAAGSVYAVEVAETGEVVIKTLPHE